jgi:hypothetical protein
MQKTIALCDRVVRWQDVAFETVVAPMIAMSENDAAKRLLRGAQATLDALNCMEQAVRAMQQGLTEGIDHLKHISNDDSIPVQEQNAHLNAPKATERQGRPTGSADCLFVRTLHLCLKHLRASRS